MGSDIINVKAKIRSWWDKPDQDYDALDAHGVHSPEEKEMWRSGLDKLLEHKKGLKILDIGTGTGFLALLLTEMGHDVTGADWATTKIQRAMEKASVLNLPIKFEVQDAENLSFEDGIFDAVVSRHVLWTLADPYTASKEWVRVTRPGGKIIVDVPRMGSHSGDHHFGAEIGESLPFYRGAEPEKVSNMFNEAGLSNIDWLLLEAPGDFHRKTLLIHGEKL